MTGARIFFFLALLFISAAATAEGNCPPGQYPIGGQGTAGCAPIPQQNSTVSQEARPTGKWLKTWGAIAVGRVDSIPYYGVPTGAMSKSEAEQQALERCAKKGPTNCSVAITYQNQCAAIGEPRDGDKPSPIGLAQFVSAPTKEMASDGVLKRCLAKNAGMRCEVIYIGCSEPVFRRY
ncbi:DUF4189 domain-containing protein [Xanthomonas protegens]|uniref:DUF4189 domain-containing protein n=1 Tax=Xanthomonas protegens TaxID=3380705 RepID=A0ABU9LF05_9XANT